MGLNLNIPKTEENLSPRITVVGVGGAGGNAVNNMIASSLEGVEFLVANTDAQALNGSICETKIQLGRNITAGLGAGARPEIGRAAAEEALDEIIGHLEGSHMVFVAAGMGGGTGTGAAPVIARAARDAGLLTVGVVTKPFQFEGIHRMRLAETGIGELAQHVDTLIIIPNQNLFRVANEKTTFADAFKMADDVLYSGVRGVTDLMVMPGLINLDFADIRSVMTEMGKAMMGTGEAEGDNRAIAAAEAAIANPLLDEVSMKGARGVLINITGGADMTLFEVDEAANRIRDEVDPEANIIFGSCLDDSLSSAMRVSVVATGIDSDAAREPRPVNLSVVSAVSTRNAPADEKTSAASALAGTARSEPAPIPAAPVEIEQPMPQAAEVSETVMEAEVETTREVTMDDLLPEDTAVETMESEPVAEEPLEEPEFEIAAEEEEPKADVREAFIAPQPMTVERNPLATPDRPKADPFAAADIANAASHDGEAHQAPKRNKAYSLFSKVTGVARAMQGGGEEAPVAKSEPTMAASKPREEEMVQAAPQKAEGKRPPQRTPAPRSSQPSLSGLEREENPHQADEDLLDIPAFLRRQAN